jgi:hypothetical protein
MPMPSIRLTSGAFSLYCIATMPAPIIGAIADSKIAIRAVACIVSGSSPR